MKDLIKHIAQALVDHPEAVEVSEVEGKQTSVFELKVAKDERSRKDPYSRSSNSVVWVEISSLGDLMDRNPSNTAFCN